MNPKRGPLALIIIDGWGYSDSREGNAIALAATPFYDELTQQYPHTLLEAHGSRVGLPPGIMGNSEVGHLNIGSGRVIRMDVSLVDHEIETGAFFKNKVLLYILVSIFPGVFYYPQISAQAVTEIITNYNGFWRTGSSAISAVKPDTHHQRPIALC